MCDFYDDRYTYLYIVLNCKLIEIEFENLNRESKLKRSFEIAI